MARPLRVQFEHAVYHVTARGNERRAIFRSDADRQRFLDSLGEMAERFGVVVHAYCLMPNHYHLLVQTPRANLSEAAGWLQTTYSVRFNRRHGRCGHLFQGRFKAHLVDADAYARVLIAYIHLNPVRPRDRRQAVAPERAGELRRYAWSSHRAYAGLIGSASAPGWLCLDWLSYFGRTRGEAQRGYRRAIAALFGKPAPQPFGDLQQGLVLGGAALWGRAQSALEAQASAEAIRWRRRAAGAVVAKWARQAAGREPDRRVAIWLRTRLGGERQSEIAREFGYADASGVHRVAARLEMRAKGDAELANKLRQYRTGLSNVKS